MARKKSPEEIVSSERKFIVVCDLLKSIAICGVVAFLGYRVVTMMQAALTAKPECLEAFAKCFKEWNVVEVISVMASGIFGGGWYFEHKRNDKLVKRNGEIRHEVESSDKVSTRSGLDEVGRTPKE